MLKLSTKNKYLLCFIILIVFSIPAYSQRPLKDKCHIQTYSYTKNHLMTKRGRMLDPEKGGITTSEGQGYLLTMAVVMNDRKTFDNTFSWTKKNMQRKDKLFSWILKKNKDGTYSIPDHNSASDADVNIALALCFAHAKWKDKKYLNEAMPIINSIWNRETKNIGKHRVLMPGNVQTKSPKIEINPSYFHPYAFKFFNKHDKIHNWNKLVDSSYYYIIKSSESTKTKLPPNWFFIEKGKIVLDSSSRSDFSYDAIRVFKKTYIDYIRTGDKRAYMVLSKSKFFIKEWKSTKKMYTNYTSDGLLRDLEEFHGSIITLVPAIAIFDSKFAAEIFNLKIGPYITDINNWKKPKDYYTKALIWHGCHFYNESSEEWKGMSEVSKELKKQKKEMPFNLPFSTLGLTSNKQK